VLRRRHPPQEPADPPRPGQRVSFTGRGAKSAVTAHVLEARPGGLTLELEPSARARRGGAEIVWAEPRGLARLRGRVWLVKPGPPPALELRFDRPPELTQRRQHVRAEVELPFRAWSLVEPTRLLSGTTLNLSGGGALVRLPELPPATSVLDLTLALPDGPIGVRARVVRRDEAGVVALAFDELGEQEARLSSLAMQRVAPPSA
jgi:PilZ domain